MVDKLALYLGVYVLMLFVMSYVISRKQSNEDFLISGRNRGGWQILSSKFAAAIGAGYFISYTGFAYEYGLGLFAMLIGIFLGYLVFAYWAAPKIALGSKEKKFYTIGDYVYDKTKSKFSMYLADIFSSTILFGWLLTGIIGGAKIIADFGLLSYHWGVIITSLVVLIYLLMAGHRAVILTDVVQSIIIFVLLIVITFGIIGSKNLSSLLSVETGSVELGVALGFFLFGLLSVFSFSDRYQLSYAAKNRKELKHGLGLAIVPILFVGLFLLLIGMFMAANAPGLDSGLIFTEALKNFLPASLLPFAIVLFFAGIMSSADTNIYAISSHYAMHTNGEKVRSVRKATIVLVVIISLLAIAFPNVVDVSIIAGGLSLTLSFSMIYVLSGGRKPSKFALSSIFSMLVLILGLVFLGIEPIVALPVLLAGALGLLIRWKKFDEKFVD
jgi:Na+/proline symporter